MVRMGSYLVLAGLFLYLCPASAHDQDCPTVVAQIVALRAETPDNPINYKVGTSLAVPPTRQSPTSVPLVPAEVNLEAPTRRGSGGAPLINKESHPRSTEEVLLQAKMLGYRDPSFIASGGMASAMQAQSGNRHVIVKMARTEEVEKYLSVESSLVSQLHNRIEDRFHHPNAQKAGEPRWPGPKVEASTLFPRMKLVEQNGIKALEILPFYKNPADSKDRTLAPTLNQRIAAKTLTPEMKVQVAQELLTALQMMHEAGILHRDIKPSNILVNDQGHIQLLDFGLAREKEEIVRDENVFGTPSYISPEYWRTNIANEANDVHALTVTLVEMMMDGWNPSNTFFRSIAGSPLRNVEDFKMVPEEFLGEPAFAVAIGSRWPTTVKKKREIFDRALGVMNAASNERFQKRFEFFSWYGRELASLDREAAAYEILSSRELIRRFKYSLRLNETEQKEIIIATKALKLMAGEQLHFGPHVHLPFDELISRSEQN